MQVNQSLESDPPLAKRMQNLEDSYDARSMITRQMDTLSVMDENVDSRTITTVRPRPHIPSTIQEFSIARFEFEDALEASKVYKRVLRDTCDASFSTSIVRTHAWSVFSGMSMGNISVMSVIALPLYIDEISNSEHYCFEQGFVRSNGFVVDEQTLSSFGSRKAHESALHVNGTQTIQPNGSAHMNENGQASSSSNTTNDGSAKAPQDLTASGLGHSDSTPLTDHEPLPVSSAESGREAYICNRCGEVGKSLL